MAEQLLDRAQIAPSIEQMRRKRVAHRVGRDRGGQAKLHPRLFGHLGNQPRPQRPAAFAAKQGLLSGQIKGAELHICINGGTGDRNDRHNAFLATFPNDAQRLSQWRMPARERERF